MPLSFVSVCSGSLMHTKCHYFQSTSSSFVCLYIAPYKIIINILVTYFSVPVSCSLMIWRYCKVLWWLNSACINEGVVDVQRTLLQKLGHLMLKSSHWFWNLCACCFVYFRNYFWLFVLVMSIFTSLCSEYAALLNNECQWPQQS